MPEENILPSQEVSQKERPINRLDLEVKNDLSIFRTANPLPDQLRTADRDVLDSVVKEAEQYYINGMKADKKLYQFIEEYQLGEKMPYSVEYFGLKEVYNDNTEEDFQEVDAYILEALRNAKQKTTPEAYSKLTFRLEQVIGLTEDSEPFHRLEELLKFIRKGRK